MLIVNAFIESEDHYSDAIRDALPDLIAAVRAEDGCEHYGCYQDTGDENRFVFVERWRDRAALDRHLVTPHMISWTAFASRHMTSARGYVYDVSSVTEIKPKELP